MIEVGLTILVIFIVIGGFAVLSVIMLTRPRDMREDQYRSGGELDGYKVVKKWHEEE